MGKKSKTPEAEKVQVANGVEAETKDGVQTAVAQQLFKIAQRDIETLQNETADQVRERLAKSQKIAREIMATLKAERVRCEKLEALLEQHKIPVPPREAVQMPDSLPNAATIPQKVPLTQQLIAEEEAKRKAQASK
mmetsp:Transcript_19488/g.23337  ORF Transcript_19488/g.23337 Transcript_19488/m.23337 type:complete len:136 (-) Transcript_19488:646-1053(-)|eukprot:CAMPEP_0197857784 /NCGR_PEP_ID=MMETSP1438-20131217/31168_1 /TAXON_ID=1461541 /ORGANISM="Pterosperma sp., Strain CCMP1384" /LENGTH=135 /DNA_ID=CAMNT_0043473745 /DNA_START=10 /DNA_END=417 /DNA_ORIENTATION=-